MIRLKIYYLVLLSVRSDRLGSIKGLNLLNSTSELAAHNSD